MDTAPTKTEVFDLADMPDYIINFYKSCESSKTVDEELKKYNGMFEQAGGQWSSRFKSRFVLSFKTSEDLLYFMMRFSE